MFYIVGLGLCDEKDITIRGLEIVKKAHRVYLESYTSVIGKSKEELEEFYGRELLVADREFVEQEDHAMLFNADKEDVALLVVGDPFGATTHTDLMLRAQKLEIPTQVVHNASIINAVGCCGLQLYNFGETVSIPYWNETWKPDSYIHKIKRNVNAGLHTLCLLDIQVKEPTLASLTKKKKEYNPPRFMSVKEATNQLLFILQDEETRNAVDALAPCPSDFTRDTLCVGLARVGSMNQKIVACSLERMTSVDLGEPLHSLVIVGKLHPHEEEFLRQFYLPPL